MKGTKKEASRELARLVVQVEDGQFSVKTGPVGDLCERWYENGEARWTARTAHGYRRILDLRIIPKFGATPLRKLRAADIDAWYAQLRKKGGRDGKPLDADTVKRIHGVLHAALKQGVRWGWLAANPSDKATPPRTTKHDIVLPTPAEVLRLVEASAKVNWALPYFLRLAAVTGARRGELCALQWKHVDFERRQLTIGHSIQEISGTPLLEKDTKSHATRRIGLDDRTLELLRELRAKQDEVAAKFDVPVKADGHLFSHEIDACKPWRPHYVSLAFGRLARELNLPGVRLHDLRHFVATLMLVGGQDVRTVSGRLGHANAVTTLGIYAHFMEAADHKAADLMGRLLDEGPSQRASRK